jgi:enamine deaminase RidA (YjgF/YER057c/UK114 family)
MRALPLVALVCAAAILAPSAQRKKKKEEETQTLQLPKDLPAAVIGDTRHLRFVVTPLSGKGLLSQQVHDALKVLAREAGSDTVLHVRAFTAGSGDMRRVRDLVSEFFAERRQPLPALSLIQSGGLPFEGAQVVLEGAVAGKKESAPNGLVFLSAQMAASDGPTDPVEPLTAKALAGLRESLKNVGLEAADVARVTCYFSSLDSVAASRKLVEAEYPRAALNYVQPTRSAEHALAACEAVARAHQAPPGGTLRIAPEDGQSPAAFIVAPQVVFTGTQNSFGYQEQDTRLAFGRLQKALEQAGASLRDAAYVRYYPLSTGITAQIRKVRPEFFDPARPPAGTLVLVEGLTSMDAGFAVDVVAAKN